MSSKQNTLRKITLFAVVIAFFVIGLGAFTRLVHAGLGCPDWPGCYGHLLWPNTEHEIAAANAAWPDAQVETDKTWPEMIHRYFASSLGLLAIFILLFAIKNRQQLKISLKLPVIILAAVIIQGLFGMWTVTLKLWPQVVTGHLLGGFTVLSLFWLLYLNLKSKNTFTNIDQNKLKSIKRFTAIALCIVVLQIALGGWTTSNYAAVACPDLPTCQQQWWPAMDFKQGFNFTQHIGPNYLGGVMDNAARVAIHMSHRIGACVTIIALLLLGLIILKAKITQLRPKLFALWGVLALQVMLGLSNIIFNFPIAVAVLHNVVGALLLLKMISLYFTCYALSRSESQG